MKNPVLHIILLCSLYSTITFAQPWYFFDDFEEYFVGLQLACQNPIDWTTWSNSPCGFEDPYITNLNAFSGQNSVKIDYWSDLIKPLGDYTTYGIINIRFYIYIPSNYTGYFALYSRFTPDTCELGAEFYFDLGENGRLVLGTTEIINFNYQYDDWQFVEIDVYLDSDFAQFSIDNLPIHSWQWSQNGTITKQLAAHNFFGKYSTSNEMYVDNYGLNDNWLSNPPNAPSNLIVQEIFNPQIQVQLNWQDNSSNEYAFKIIRKDGLPNSTNSYSIIDTVYANTTQYIDSIVLVDSTYTYGVIAFNIYGNSDTSNVASITVLPIPVELVSFTSEVINNNATLNWITATETNNRGFDVQRCEKSEVQSPDWEKIGFVNGHGTTTEPQFYSFKDESLQPGKYQYWLKQIDFDGSFEYSKVVEVTVQEPTEFSLSQNYPNPFNPTTHFEFRIADFGFVSLKVYDVLGNEIATLVNEEKPAGEYEVEFNGSELPSGIYFYQLKAGNYIESKKLVLMK